MTDDEAHPGLDQRQGGGRGLVGAAVVVDGDQLDLAPEHPAGLVQHLDRQLDRGPHPLAGGGERAREAVGDADTHIRGADGRCREQKNCRHNATKRTEHGVRLQSSLVDPLVGSSGAIRVRYYTNVGDDV